METQPQKYSGKNGGALVLAMVVLLAFSILTIGLLKLQDVNTDETVYASQTQQAFWLAESGLEDVIRKIQWEPGYRANPTNVTMTTNNGVMAYTGMVVSASLGLYNSTNYTIQSVGWVNGAQRTLQRGVNIIAGPVANDVGVGGKFGANNEIDGLMIVRPGGKMDTGNNATSKFDDFILANPTNSVSGNGDVAGVLQLPDDYVPPYLENPNDYLNTLAAVVSDGSAPTTNGTTITYHTNYVDFGAANVTVKLGYKLIFPGNVDFGNNNASLSNNVTVVAGGNISFPGQSSIGEGTIIYARTNIVFATHSASYNASYIGVALLSQYGDITFKSQVTYDGLLFANDGTIYIHSGTEFDGVLVAADGVDKSDTGSSGIGSVSIGFDPSLINSNVLSVAIFNWGNSVNVTYTSGSWEEL